MNKKPDEYLQLEEIDKTTFNPTTQPFTPELIVRERLIEEFGCPYFSRMPSIKFRYKTRGVIKARNKKQAESKFKKRWEKVTENIDKDLKQLAKCSKCPFLAACTSLTLVRLTREQNEKE